MPCSQLWTSQNDAKESETPCDIDSSSEDASTTGGLCYLAGCDEIPGGKREGPGKSYWLYLVSYLSSLLNAGNRSNGGFDPNSVDWTDV